MVERLAWVMLALIHATPALALFRPGLLTRLYGSVPSDASFLLLQHRAALFLVVVIVALWAMADPAVRRLAAVAVGVSMLSFLWLYAMAGRPPAFRTIAIADLVGLLALMFVGWKAWAH